MMISTKPHKTKKRRKQISGEQQLASLVLSPRSNGMDKFPNDPLETLILIVASIGVIGGIYALVYLARINGAI